MWYTVRDKCVHRTTAQCMYSHGKLKKNALATHSNNERLNPSEKHQAKDFLKILADLPDQRAVYLKC